MRRIFGGMAVAAALIAAGVAPAQTSDPGAGESGEVQPGSDAARDTEQGPRAAPPEGTPRVVPAPEEPEPAPVTPGRDMCQCPCPLEQGATPGT